MCLGIVFQQQEVVSAADVANLVCIGTATVKVYQHDGAGMGCQGRLYECVVNLEGGDVWLDEHWH